MCLKEHKCNVQKETAKERRAPKTLFTIKGDSTQAVSDYEAPHFGNQEKAFDIEHISQRKLENTRKKIEINERRKYDQKGGGMMDHIGI